MIFNANEVHLYTLIILHGMFQTSKSLISLANYIQNYNKNIKIILPDAPKRNISWTTPPDYNVSSWYNYYTRYDGLFIHDKINKNNFDEQTKRINNLIERESKLVNYDKIIIAGISQGGTLALNIGLKYPKKLGGIIGIHTIFMDNVILLNSLNNIPIYLFSGNKDNIYNIEFQKKSFKKLRSKNITIANWVIENNLGHCQYSDKEYEFFITSIQNILM
jgi:phospholipase/carboxylesterase